MTFDDDDAPDLDALAEAFERMARGIREESDWYVLENGVPRPVPMLMGAMALEHRSRVIAQEHSGRYWVSTVFLGLDHAFGGGPPVLFETMTFRSGENGADDRQQDRYHTMREAIEGHRGLCEWARWNTPVGFWFAEPLRRYWRALLAEALTYRPFREYYPAVRSARWPKLSELDAMVERRPTNAPGSYLARADVGAGETH